MILFLAHLVITAGLLLVVANIVEGIEIEGWGPALLGALVLGLALAGFYGYRAVIGIGAGMAWDDGALRRDVGHMQAELDALAGRSRVWIVFSHDVPAEREFFVEHLDLVWIQPDLWWVR